ncbi:hypothetical protein Tco_0527160 [Tanacetum coccineum]
MNMRGNCNVWGTDDEQSKNPFGEDDDSSSDEQSGRRPRQNQREDNMRWESGMRVNIPNFAGDTLSPEGFIDWHVAVDVNDKGSRVEIIGLGEHSRWRAMINLGLTHTRITSALPLTEEAQVKTKDLKILSINRSHCESFHEAWDRYKDLLRAFPHHSFTELHQLDTFYNALNPTDQDSLNYAAGGNLLESSTQDVLTIIENKSKVRNSRNKSIVSQVKSSDVNSSFSSEIAKLTMQ